jgi:hypothetical protein
MSNMSNMIGNFTDFCELLACAFLGLLAAILLYKIATNKIDLEWLISENNGHASMAKFQLMVFTFVIAISLIRLVENTKDHFPPIEGGVLTLLGISASTYAVGKGLQQSGSGTEPVAPNSPKPDPSPSVHVKRATDAANAATSAAQDAQQAARQAAAHTAKAQDAADIATNAAQGSTQAVVDRTPKAPNDPERTDREG